MCRHVIVGLRGRRSPAGVSGWIYFHRCQECGAMGPEKDSPDGSLAAFHAHHNSHSIDPGSGARWKARDKRERAEASGDGLLYPRRAR
jgi:hypothetical protein